MDLSLPPGQLSFSASMDEVMGRDSFLFANEDMVFLRERFTRDQWLLRRQKYHSLKKCLYEAARIVFDKCS